jgi:HEAT repeat protein
MGRPAVPIFIRALDSDNRNVRWEAAKALEEIGDPSAAEALVAKLDHDHFGIRWLVAEGLISFGRQGLEPLLLALLNDPDAAFLREGAHHVLHALCDADPSLQDILSPLAEALGAFAETGEIIPRVQAVLKAIRDKCDTHRTEISEQTREQ